MDPDLPIFSFSSFSTSPFPVARGVEGKTGKCEAVGPNLKAKQNWKEEIGWIYRSMTDFLSVYFAVNIFLFL